MNNTLPKIKIYYENLIDSALEFHMAWHKNINEITELHTHDFFEIFVITKGRVKHIINGHSLYLEKGTLIFMRPDDIHSYEKVDKSEFELINLAFPKRTIEKMMEFIGGGINIKYLINRDTPSSVLLGDVELKLLINKLKTLQLIDREQTGVLNTSFKVLLLDLFTKYFSDFYSLETLRYPKWIVELTEEMSKKENFVSGFRAMQIISGRSKEHLCREFKKHFNTTPTTYINNLRLNYSANLLSGTDESITYISMEAGFENLSHFYHVFKKKFGKSPGQFRKQNQKIFIP